MNNVLQGSIYPIVEEAGKEMTCHSAMLEVRAVEVWRWEYLCYTTKISDHESDTGVSV